MTKIFWVAWREFVATVATKGFVIGVLITPVMIAIMIPVMKAAAFSKPPQVKGELAVVDPTGEVAPRLKEYLGPEAIARRWDLFQEQALEAAPEGVRRIAGRVGSLPETREALEAVLGKVPLIEVVRLGPETDVEAEKEPLRGEPAEEGGRLALAVIHPDAVRKADAADGFGKYDLFVREKGLDERIEDELKNGLHDSIVAARIHAAGLDRAQIESLTRVGRVRSKTVTKEGEQETNEVLNALLPAGFMVLLLVSVITSGQQIMTTTIEEKSNRVVEVLLSAVSPMQLMTGKIVGQMCVGLLVLGIYSGMGIAALVSFAMFGLIDRWLFFYLVIFYFIAYFIMGSMMAAIGAAVNELREAQTLMTPVMLTMMLPWLMWFFIVRDPNSVFALVTSFLPPINTFVMLLRMTSSAPPPWWQIWLSILVGVASVYGALWFAAKVFRVGLLMYGKPPGFATLVRWVRAA